MRQPFATQIWSSFGMDTALFFECVLLYVYSKKPYAQSKEPRRQILHSFWVCIVLCILKKALHTIKRTQYTDSKSPIYIPKCHVWTLFECVQFYKKALHTIKRALHTIKRAQKTNRISPPYVPTCQVWNRKRLKPKETCRWNRVHMQYMYTQKRPVWNLKELYIHPKKSYIYTKMPCMHPKESYRWNAFFYSMHTQKSPVWNLEQPYIPPTYIQPKEPYVQPKEPCMNP